MKDEGGQRLRDEGSRLEQGLLSLYMHGGRASVIPGTIPSSPWETPPPDHWNPMESIGPRPHLTSRVVGSANLARVILRSMVAIVSFFIYLLLLFF